MTSRARPKAAKPRAAIRSRTRSLLLDAAVRQFAKQGVGATTIQQIALEAGVANGTFYNYFRTRDEVVEAVNERLVARLHDEIAARSGEVDDPAERVAIGCRRFILQAQRDPTWGAATLRLWSQSAELVTRAAEPARDDLRTGKRRGRFTFPTEDAAVDLLQGAVLAGMRTVLEGRRGAEHASAVAALVLRSLGVGAAEAESIASRPLPPARRAPFVEPT
jgi:AcrR family transcriptional regulator